MHKSTKKLLIFLIVHALISVFFFITSYFPNLFIAVTFLILPVYSLLSPVLTIVIFYYSIKNIKNDQSYDANLLAILGSIFIQIGLIIAFLKFVHSISWM